MSREGTIKYKLHHTKALVRFDEQVEQLIYLRQELLNRGFVGVYPNKHPVFPMIGYGNVSMRYGEKSFAITGSQTGHIKKLTRKELVLVKRWSIKDNMVYSTGLLEPSSEALTHAAIYECTQNVKFVAHGHVIEIWENSKALGLDSTPREAEYGTPDLALEIKKLCSKDDSPRIISLKGHQEGIIVWGTSPKQILELLDTAFDELATIKRVR